MRHRFFLLLNRAHRALKTRVERETHQVLGLTSLELTALWVLRERPGIGIAELAEHLHVDHAVVSRLCPQLLRKEVAERGRDLGDARRRPLRLTPKGEDLARRGAGLLASANQAITAPFTPEELDVVARFLNHLVLLGTSEDP